ncbi:MAG: GtrA family protein [Bacillota bacterium]|nr:GtrA family protein [Bacillota bacterium]
MQRRSDRERSTARKEAGYAARFVIVGIINTLTGCGIMFSMYNLAGCSYWLSSAANYVLTSILSYFLNKRFTFRHRGDLTGSALRFAVNIAVCYFLAFGIAKPLTMWLLDGCSVRIQENTAMFAGMCFFTVFNYSGQRFFAFRNK